jgi:ubiquinol-cytochrome c reductase cytochrome b subunit
VRTALGAATIAFYTVLHLSASNDLLAKWLTFPVDTITWVYRIAVLVLPPIVGYVTYRLMKALKLSGAERFRDMPLKALGLREPTGV